MVIRKAENFTYELAFVIRLVVLTDLWDTDVCIVVRYTCRWLEEDEWKRRWGSVGFLNCSFYSQYGFHIKEIKVLSGLTVFRIIQSYTSQDGNIFLG